LLGFNKHKSNDKIIALIRNAIADASHPLLLPIILIHSWMNLSIHESGKQYNRVQDIRNAIEKVSAPALSSGVSTEFDKAQEKIIDIHNTMNNSVSAFLTNSTANLHKALIKLSYITTNAQASDAIRQFQKDFEALLPVWDTAVNCQVDVRVRIRKRLNMQLQVV
jgi:hypothetical protein